MQRVIGADNSDSFGIIERHVTEVQNERNHHKQILQVHAHAQWPPTQQDSAILTIQWRL